MAPAHPPGRSVSLGCTSHGRLLRGVALPARGPHHSILPGYRLRHTYFGTQELVELVLHAAQRVARRHPGAQLRVGNMSLRNGGDLPWSVSHNAGRDADLAFYLTVQGRPQPSPSLVKVGADLRSRAPAGYRFDLARNWTLVEALLTHPSIQVQWIFVARPIREALLAHGRRQGASAAVLQRADLALRQPTDSLSHDDHFHLRVYCSREDRLEGCHNRGPMRPGVEDHGKAVAARIRLLLPGLTDPEPAIRGRVIQTLERLDARREALHLARALRSETDPDNQRALLALLGRWEIQGAELVAELGRFLGRDDLGPGAPLRLAYALLGRSGGPLVLALIQRGLLSERVLPRAGREPPVTEAELAARAALVRLDRRLVPALIGALDSPKGAVRQAAVEALRRTTNHSFGLRWTGALPPTRRKKQIARWQAFWDRYGKLSREALVIRGFRQLGPRWEGLGHPGTLRFLIALTRGADHLAHNAHWLLLRQARPHAEARTPRSPLERHAAWQRWYRQRYAARARPRARPRRPGQGQTRRLVTRSVKSPGTLAVARKTAPAPAAPPAPVAPPAVLGRWAPRPSAGRAPQRHPPVRRSQARGPRYAAPR